MVFEATDKETDTKWAIKTVNKEKVRLLIRGYAEDMVPVLNKWEDTVFTLTSALSNAGSQGLD